MVTADGAAAWHAGERPGSSGRGRGRLSHPRRFSIAAALCVIVQLGLTIALPPQAWSMPLGLAVLNLICSAVTMARLPRFVDENDQWRWRLAALGFGAGALSWLASAYQDTVLSGDQSTSRYVSVFQYAFLMGVMVPGSPETEDGTMQVLDFLQCLLFAAVLKLTSWPRIWGPVYLPDIGMTYLGYATLVTMAVIGVLTHGEPLRGLCRVMLMLHLLYALVSAIGVQIYRIWPDTDVNAPFWVIGDASFLAYIVLLERRVPTPPLDDPPPRAGALIGVRQHGAPLLLALLVLVLAFELGEVSGLWGGACAIAALTIYATRAMLLEERYLHARGALILAEQDRARGMIETMHAVRGAVATIERDARAIAATREAPLPVTLVQSLHGGSRGMSEMLNAVLALEGVQAGTTPPRAIGFDVRDAVRAAIAQVAAEARAGGATIDLYADTAPLDVVSDPAVLRHLLVLLLRDAIEARPAAALPVRAYRDGAGAVAIGLGGTPTPAARRRFAALLPRVAGSRQALARTLAERLGARLDLAPVARGGAAILQLGGGHDED